MPKKKTGQRRKAEKQKLRQKEIRTAKDQLDLAKFPCNAVMVNMIYYNVHQYYHNLTLLQINTKNKSQFHKYIFYIIKFQIY